jgi:hypothetical protein
MSQPRPSGQVVVELEEASNRGRLIDARSIYSEKAAE